jgi:hypothetical protein
MDRKKIIQLVIIIAAFGGSGIILYNGMFKNASPVIPPVPGLDLSAASGTPTAVTGSQILPYGDKFEKKDLDGVLYNRGLVYGTIQYPILDPAQVGVLPQNLIPPAPSAEEAQ